MSKVNFFKDVLAFQNIDVTVKHILVLGCGGTGAYVVAHLARILEAINSTSSQQIKLTLVDGDEVEEKNLKRQHFVQSDMGKNKAEVLASRYSSAFGIEIDFIPSYLERPFDLKKALLYSRHESYADLIIGCVDNNATRAMIHSALMSMVKNSNTFWIDSGNEEIAGQVVCGFMSHNWAHHTDKKLFSLPFVTEVYPEMLEAEDKFSSELSCAERAEAAPQNMMTNVTAATLVLNYAQSILFRRPMKSHGVTFNINNVFSTMQNIDENLCKVHESRLSGMDRQLAKRKKGD